MVSSQKPMSFGRIISMAELYLPINTPWRDWLAYWLLVRFSLNELRFAVGIFPYALLKISECNGPRS